ncbi:MAG: AEC family transporter, partial [Clostridia bacterium]|nr:AEC family transporter [Clostridia bacterium]
FMNIAPLVAQQVFIMLILIIIGFLLTKKNIISQQGSKNISDILLTIVTPSVLIRAYQIDFDIKIAKEIAIACGLAVLTHILFIVVSHILFIKVKDQYKRKVLEFTSIYSNCGFMGIPLLAATLGDKGVLLGSTYLAAFNVITWTQGLYIYCEDFKMLSVKQLLKNPGVLGTCVALLLFFAKIRLGGVISDTIGYVADLNTPLAMILLGTYLARTDLIQSLKNGGIYIVSFVRLLLLPILALLVFKLLGVEYNMAMSLILPAACPCAAIAAMFAEKVNLDPGYPSQIVSVTTIFSLATLPFIAYMAAVIL